MQDFVNAADCYEQLTVLNPEVEDYRYGRLNHSTRYKSVNMIIVISRIVGDVFVNLRLIPCTTFGCWICQQG